MPEKKPLATVLCAAPSRTEQQPASTGAHKTPNPPFHAAQLLLRLLQHPISLGIRKFAQAPSLSNHCRTRCGTHSPQLLQKYVSVDKGQLPQIHPSSQWKICVQNGSSKQPTPETSHDSDQTSKRVKNDIAKYYRPIGVWRRIANLRPSPTSDSQ